MSALTAVSTGIDPNGWRAWWREQSRLDGTDWETITWQHISALYALRRICGASS